MQAGISFLTKWKSLAARAMAIGLVLLCAGVVKAQDPQDENPANGVTAGGKWTVARSEDRMTSAKRARFDLPAENAPDSVDRARIILYCSDGKMNLANFRPNMRLGRPDWPGFWGQPQMRVTVRVNDSHDTRNWNWVNGHFLAMDKGTVRGLIGARLFRVEFSTPEGPKIGEFSPAGLDLNLVKSACGLTPKKPYRTRSSAPGDSATRCPPTNDGTRGSTACS